jgi:serine protease AprX
MMKLANFFLACIFFMALAMPATADIDPYQDVRNQDLSSENLTEELIRTLEFNQGTIFPRYLSIFADQVMEDCKNPGLGVRSLHQQGYTGQGVNVAIIDQNLAYYRNLEQMHPEFSGKLIDYMDVGTGMAASKGSYHGSAVLSLLVGETIGVAPGARVYYVAAPMWKQDAKYFADALNLIIAANGEQGLNIRVVSISTTPSGPVSPFINQDAYDEAVAAAEKAGIMVLDCGSDRILHIRNCYYDPGDPENVAHVSIGQPGISSTHACSGKQIHAPDGYRTWAEQYGPGEYHYIYGAQNGISWSIPYVAGILALGWQLKPQLSGAEMVDLLVLSAFHKKGCNIIDPLAFIKAVKKAK